jgi:hypothetical protein
MSQLKTVFAAALAVTAAACSSPQSAPEPENEATAAAMPETPDRSDTAADEKAAGMATPAPAGEAGKAGTVQPEPASTPAY